MAWRFLEKINFIDRGLVNAVKCSANALDGWNGSDEVYNITHSDILQLGDFKVGRNIGNESYGLHGAHDTWMHFYNESNNWYYRALVIYKNGSDVVHYTQITQSYDDDFYYGIAVNDDISRAALIQVRVNRNSGSIVDATAWFYASGTFTFEDFYNAFRCGDQYYSSSGAGAGSGYIGNSLLSNKKMVGFNVPTSSAEGTKTESVNDVSASAMSGKPKSGNGFARIKYIGEPDYDIWIDGKRIYEDIISLENAVVNTGAVQEFDVSHLNIDTIIEMHGIIQMKSAQENKYAVDFKHYESGYLYDNLIYGDGKLRAVIRFISGSTPLFTITDNPQVILRYTKA